ncbi:MAG: DUF2510 domain-containing protein [Pseudolysinimonas sp.]
MSELGSETASAAPAAGWYPDPADPSASRWWSGVAWTDHVQRSAVAAVPASPALAVAAVPATATVSRAANLDSDGVPLTLFADAAFDPAVLTPAAKPTSQYDWHAQSGHAGAPKRQVAGTVSLSTGVPAGERKNDPYRQRNWIAGVALALAIVSIPALAAKALITLPAASQGIFAGAPIALSLLALVVSVRRGRGVVISIIALVLSGVTLAAGLLVDPAVLRAMLQPVADLLGL